MQEYGDTHEDGPMNYSERIKAARKYARLTQRELADQVGIDQTSISNLERGKSRGSSHTASIARCCNVSAFWLETGIGEMIIGPEGERATLTPYPGADTVLAGPFNIWDSETPLHEFEVFLPFLVERDSTDEPGKTSIVIDHSERVRFDKQILIRQRIPLAEAVCIRVKGNSMAPYFPDGATVAIHLSSTQVTDGKLYGINHGGLLRVKTLYRLPGGGLRLRSVNSTEFPDEDLDLEACARQGLSVLGRVFWYTVIL